MFSTWLAASYAFTQRRCRPFFDLASGALIAICQRYNFALAPAARRFSCCGTTRH
jgi:hypothetical protein